MKIAMYQMEIVWGDIPANLQKVKSWLEVHSNEADLLVLPEMFATGFCVESPELSEDENGQILRQLRIWSETYHIAIIGSMMWRGDGDAKSLNRAFFIKPSDSPVFYDKRHLFRMGSEGVYFSQGDKRVVVEYMGLRFLLQICYDLRFPVFSRCRENDYDVAVYVACWPKARVEAWKILLPARAVENLSYVCGVNAVGLDNGGRQQGGHSMLVDMKGECLAHLDELEDFAIVEIEKEKLEKFRHKFPAWKDADLYFLSETE